MCGLSIVFYPDGFSPPREIIDRMNKSLEHRGPDAKNVIVRKGIGLGHTRLSIVDHKKGQQPMLSQDNRFCIVFNGEIYNYKELRENLLKQGIKSVTESDTEVILLLYHLYGKDCLKYIQGMFSFVIHDKLNEEVFIARDRLGIKPLFYYYDNHVLVVASEIKAIFASGLVEPKFSMASIKNYFRYQFSISPNTLFESIKELEPGHYIALSANIQLTDVCYWDIDFPKESEIESYSETQWESEFESIMEKTVENHMIGEVDIGAYLSGGIDSASIVSLLSEKYNQKLKTFSIGFENNHLDESAEYKSISRFLNVDNEELIMQDQCNADYIGLLRDCLYHLEQPQRLAVDIPHYLLSDMVNKSNYKVVYTGDGADEVLVGYDCYRQDSMRCGSNSLWGTLTRRYKYMHKYTKYFAKDHMEMLLQLHNRKNQKKTIQKFGFYPAWYDFWSITDGLTDGMFLDDVEREASEERQIDELVHKIGNKVESRHPVHQSLYLEMKTRLPGWILWKSDRLSMAHGVEARVPFMDHRLVELLARMPADLKLKGMEEKYILKKTMSRRLPKLDNKFKKRGFYTPIREWFFTTERRELVEPYLCVASLKQSRIFNPEKITGLYEKVLKTNAPQNVNEYYQLMRLEWVLMLVLTIQILHEQYVGKSAICFDMSHSDGIRGRVTTAA